MPPRPRVLAKTPNATISGWSNVCITVIRDELNLDDVEAVRKSYKTFATETDKGFISVVIAMPDVGMPSEEARKAIPDMMKGFEKNLLAMVGILESTGFKAAAVRSAMAVMSMLSRTNYPRKIAASVHEAVPWISSHVVPSSTADVIESAIAEAKTL